MADQRVLEINVAYAQGLKDVNLFTKMDVYVTVSIVGGNNNSNIKQKTNVDRDSGTHPTWNFPMRFTVDDLQGRSSLVFKLKCEGSLSDTDIGEVCVPIKDLLDSSSVSCESKSSKFVHYQVTNPSGKGQGTLTFSYKFMEKVFGADQTVEPVERAAEAATRLQPTTYLPPQQPMEPSLSHCGFSCQDTYRPNTYPQTHVPYAYPAALPEQVLGSGYVYPPAAPNSYPPPPDPTTGFVYIYPPPQSAAPNYAYVPYHQQQLQQLVCPHPPSSGGQYDVYPYPPQADHKYGCPPQAYRGYW